MSPLGPPRNTLTHKLSRIHTKEHAPHTHDRSSCHCEVRHQHSRKEKKNKNTSMVKIISTITMLQFIKYFFQRSDSGFSSRFKAVCVCVVVVFVIVFVPLLQTHTHTHRHTRARTHTQPTYAHSRAPAHTTCPLLVEKDMAQWRDTPPPRVDARITRRRRGFLPQLPRVIQVTATPFFFSVRVQPVVHRLDHTPLAGQASTRGKVGDVL